MVVTKKVVCLVVGLILMTFLIEGCSYINDKPVSTSGKYPAKPITLIVPFAAGGSSDMIARTMEKVAMKHLGQPLIVTNMPGAAGTLAWNELAGAKPDGYTLGIVAISSILQPIYGTTRYHYPTALDPLAQITSTPIVAAVRSDQPWENIDQLVRYVKEHPGEVKYGHPGFGTSPNVTGEIFVKEAGVNIAQVPFQGESESLAALLGGHVQLIFMPPTALKEYVKSGKVKVLAVATEQRIKDPLFSNIRTFQEQGLNVIFDTWYGIGVPKGMPDDEKTRLSTGLKEILNDPEFRKNMEEMELTVDYLGPKEFSEKWLAENARLTKIIKETNIAERIAAQKK